MTIFKQFTFDSAHFLPNVPVTHKCRQIHGHTYRLTVYMNGALEPRTGWVADFSDVKNMVHSVIDQIDHKLLNDINGLENPTCELLAVWLWDRIVALEPKLKRIELYETPTSGAIYEGQ